MAKPKKKSRVMGYRRILVRCPPDLADWLDAAAAEYGMSRDNFLRVQLSAIRDGFRLLKASGTEEEALFRRLEDRIIDQAAAAVEKAVQDTIRVAGVGRAVTVPKGDKS